MKMQCLLLHYLCLELLPIIFNNCDDLIFQKDLTGKPSLEILSLVLSDELDDKDESNIFNKGSNEGKFKVHPQM